MKRWMSFFMLLAVFTLFLSGCAGNGYIRHESPGFSVNESHDLDYYQMYGP